MVNENTNMQAAVPAYEIDRLFGIMGVSIEVLNAIALIIVFVSGISIFISLYSALKERKYEMALMRTYGASRWQLLLVVLLEGLLLSCIGLFMGLVISRIGLISISKFMELNYHYSLSGLGWVNKEGWLLTIAIGIGLVASLIPAIQAFNINISKTLSDA
jgi:putative ABC transport system permease protein